ncbi:MAG: SLC13 family permease [Candidatus Methanomethyliaceae archaeon]|nr:SLC13 family permease [Candidatus Methanomethyliaceae archaeon]MDW7970590.1 SLC13 family permease [Nitrososphaerota archaeon]
MLELIALILFLIIIGLMIWGPIERSVIGGFGVVLMILLGIITPLEAFEFVDWNILAILVGLWIVSSYLIAAKMPETLIAAVLKRTKSLKAVLFALIFSAGMVTMFVDNVLVVLLFCPIVITICKTIKVDPLLPTVLTGLAANFMGVGLMLGDITPQMLHTIAGAEFMDFVIFNGRPGSFFVLLMTFLIMLSIYYKRVRFEYKGDMSSLLSSIVEVSEDAKKALKISILFFVGIIVLMSLRKFLGVPLGAIAFSGALVMALFMETLRKLGKLKETPPFSEVLCGLEWRAVFYYAFLFVLVGSIEKAGHISALAASLQPYLSNIYVGLPMLYWVSAGVASIVQFDAYNLTMFRTLKDLALTQGLDVWPYYWSVAWAATLASEATIVSAPALYVTWTLIEKEGYKISTKAFHSITVRFAITSLIFNFIITFLVFTL